MGRGGCFWLVNGMRLIGHLLARCHLVKGKWRLNGLCSGVRVEGPAVLQRNGLYGCIKNVVGGIRFPSAGTSQIISYPFTLS